MTDPQWQRPECSCQSQIHHQKLPAHSCTHTPLMGCCFNSECKCQIKRGCGKKIKFREGLLKDVFFIYFTVWGIFCINFVSFTKTPPTAKIMTLKMCRLSQQLSPVKPSTLKHNKKAFLIINGKQAECRLADTLSSSMILLQ